MTELSFAQSFLTILDTKPTKLPADYVEDPRNFPARSAVSLTPPSDLAERYPANEVISQSILPKMAKPLSKRQKIAPGAEKSITVSLKSLRNPPLDITLSSQTPNTSILDLKTAVSEKTGISADKIRVLHKKKPVGDSKVLKDVVGEDSSVEFSVMVIGGAAAVNREVEPEGTSTAPVAQGESGTELLSTDEFWADLKGFLTQRLRDEKTAETTFGVFKNAWESHGSKP
ncbi:hypothetical protein BP5796_01091 [Coleophoma crateriformis]|uniref:Ubiquitin-like domain-containing protein n=1 Tax=Coleophoma crateriformis TaxID=565419 RepID=A0A3D8TCJ8_9HELO|nr:hypothetical protein BP5796_01091 [Coleophoma crateriformis]